MRFRALVVVALVACSSTSDENVDSNSQPVKVCAGSNIVQGIDVSHYDGAIDWAKVKNSGREFAIIKVTEGTTITDSAFATLWSGSKSQGVIRGGYHFFRANLDPIAQADYFLMQLGPIQPGDLPPTLDLETTDGQSGQTIASKATQWLDHVAMKTGLRPILYTSPSFVTGTLGSPAGFQNHATLWIANWGVTCPDVPVPFTTWAFWQYSATGTVPGVASSPNIDLDEFNGSLTELKMLTVQPPTMDAGAGDAAVPDGGAPDAQASDAGDGGTIFPGRDASPPDLSGVGDSAGCSCSSENGSSPPPITGVAFVGLYALVARRRSRAPSST